MSPRSDGSRGTPIDRHLADPAALQRISRHRNNTDRSAFPIREDCPCSAGRYRPSRARKHRHRHRHTSSDVLVRRSDQRHTRRHPLVPIREILRRPPRCSQAADSHPVLRHHHKLRIDQPYRNPYETYVQLHVLLGEPFLREMQAVLSYETESVAVKRGHRWWTTLYIYI